MRQQGRILYLLFLLPALLLSSCLKEELPVTPHDPGTVSGNTVDLGSSYKWQIYYNLESNSVVGQNLKTTWDLGFESGADGYHVILNMSKSMYALNTHLTDFEAVHDTLGFYANKTWDAPHGNLDSTAIGDWRKNGFVYFIDRGYDENGKQLGYMKVQLLAKTGNQYSLRYAAIDGSGEKTVDISTDDKYNFSFLSFDSGDTVMVEPPKDTWDLVFTQYTHIFYDPFTPYLVTGCLLNRYETQAYKDSLHTFDAIERSQADSRAFTGDIDIIGYSWKLFNGNEYEVNPNMIYIIKDRKGYLYKLHFTDFYNANGVKGNPRWEVGRL